MISVSRPRNLAQLLVVAFVTVACSDYPASNHPSLRSISVSPSNSSVSLGLSQQFTATGTYIDGSMQNLTASVQWVSSNTDVATISGSGIAVSVAIGNTTITASSGSETGSTVLTVSAAALASIVVTPEDPVIELGANQEFAAVGTLTDGSTQDVTQTATWSSGDSNVLLLNNSGGRIGIGNTRGPGSTVVSATSGAIAGTTTASVVRRTPKFLYAASVASSSISAFGVDPASGALTQIPSSPFATTSGATSIAVTNDLGFLYSADFGASQISAFSIGADGSLTPVAGTPFAAGNGPVSLVAHPTANFIYVSNQGSGEIMVYANDLGTGALSLMSSVTIGNSPLFSAITIDGARFFQTVSSLNQIAGYSVSAVDGALTAIPGNPGLTRTFPRSIAIDPAGKFMYVTIPNSFAGTSTSVHAFSIDAVSGVLTEVPGSPFTSGENPVSAAVDAAGRFLFVANSTASSVSAFSIDPDTGALTEVVGSPFATLPFLLFVAADPSGQYVYVGADGGISAFEMDQATGALTSIVGSPFPGASVWSIALTH